MLIRLSCVIVVVRGGTTLWWYGIPRVEYLEVLLRAQQVSCDGILEYFTYLEVPKMSFGKESTRTDQPNFPPQHFLTKAILTARMSRQRQTTLWVGLKMDLKFYDLICVHQHLPTKKSMWPFRSISLKCLYDSIQIILHGHLALSLVREVQRHPQVLLYLASMNFHNSWAILYYSHTWLRSNQLFHLPPLHICGRSCNCQHGNKQWSASLSQSCLQQQHAHHEGWAWDHAWWGSSQTSCSKAVGTLQDGYVRNVPLPRVPREQRASPQLTAPKTGVPLPGYSRIPAWIPTLPKIGNVFEVSQRLVLWLFSPP